MNKETITRLENKIKKAQEEIKQAQAQIKGLKKEIEKPKFEYPELRDRVWYIDTFGEISHFDWIGTYFDKELFHQGGVFFTKEDCAFERERRKVIAELKMFKEPDDREWDGDIPHYFIRGNLFEGSIYYDYNYSFKHNDIYFATFNDAKNAVDFVGIDRVKKYYLRIKE